MFSLKVKGTASMGSDLAVGTRRADSLLRCKAMKGLEPRGEVVSFDEGGKVIFKLSVGLIVILRDVGLLQGPVRRSTWPLLDGWLGLVKR